jgi:hypothetical protein
LESQIERVSLEVFDIEDGLTERILLFALSENETNPLWQI